MPGRVSARTKRSSEAELKRKSSAATLRSRGSARTSAHNQDIPDFGPDNELRQEIVQIFGEAQKAISSHRKLVVTLRKLQEACAFEQEGKKKKKRIEGFSVDDFNHEFQRCVIFTLPVKKGVVEADRVVRFVGAFHKVAIEKDTQIWEEKGDGETLFDSPTAQLAHRLLQELVQHFTSKDKTVRYRAEQMVQYVLANMPQIDEELYQLIRVSFVKRLHDKEPSVRNQAVLGLGFFTNNEDEDDEYSEDDTTQNTSDRLLTVMNHDPTAEVRRTVLLNLPFTPRTLQFLLERARDVDAPTRRAVFSKCLPALGDFRHMSMQQRARLLRWGLKDRDDYVVRAMETLFRERWIEDCAAADDPNAEEERKPGVPASPSTRALEELLERISVITTGAIDEETLEKGVAHKAMYAFWEGRPDYRNFIVFEDQFFNDLDVEKAFIVRTFNDFCREEGSQDPQMLELLDEKLPPIMKMAYFIEDHLTRLVDGIQRMSKPGEEEEELEDLIEQQEFMVQQLLGIALTLDYTTDEFGRQKMFNIVRTALHRPELIESCTTLAVKVLAKVSATEAEFCDIVFESITEIRDTLTQDEPEAERAESEEPEESFHSAQSDISDTIQVKSKKAQPMEELDPEAAEEKRIREMLVYLKCLHIAECAFIEASDDVDKNRGLKTMLNTLVIPAARSHELPIREAGLKCLAQCCILSENLAKLNFGIFVYVYNNSASADTLKLIVLQAISDILKEHPSLLDPEPAEPDTTTSSEAEPTPSPHLAPVTKIFQKAFKSDEKILKEMAYTAAMPLLLRGVLKDQPQRVILKEIILAYFNPETSAYQGLKQGLTYFLPVFSHSRLVNAMLMAELAPSIINKLMTKRDQLEDEDAEEMVGWPVVAGQFAEWTDGRRVFGMEMTGYDGKIHYQQGAEEPHIQLAINIFKRALKDSCTRDERKPLLMLLSKLHVSSSRPSGDETVDRELLESLHELAEEAVAENLGLDATSRNAISKLELGLTKRLGDVERVTQTPDAEGETVTQVDEEEDTQAGAQMAVPVREKGRKSTATPTPTPDVEAEAEVASVADEVEEEEEGEDTMMANMQAEGTRMPLELDDEDEDEGNTTETPRRQVAVTESDIVDSLLNSEIED